MHRARHGRGAAARQVPGVGLMEAGLIFGAMIIAYAIASGAEKIADAIRYRKVAVHFVDPLRIEREGKNDGTPT